MNIDIKKITKNNSKRTESIAGSDIDFGVGHSTDFWWTIHFNGKDKNGLRTDVAVQMNEGERIKFIEEFEKYVEVWKKYIKEKNG